MGDMPKALDESELDQVSGGRTKLLIPLPAWWRIPKRPGIPIPRLWT